MKKNKFALLSFFLRVGLGVVLLYAATSSFLNPLSWAGFFPLWLRNIISETSFLYTFSVYEIILALWLFSSWKAFHAALLSALTMLAIIISNLGSLDIIFRDVGLLFMAVALAILHSGKFK